jgi:NADH:ubiquinone oxidoreductase subunit F (NADH-binding)
MTYGSHFAEVTENGDYSMKDSSGAHVESFYHLPSGLKSSQVCNGMACFVARKQNHERWSVACGQSTRVYCLGKCYAAPAAVHENSRPSVKIFAREGIVLKRISQGGARRIAEYLSAGGYISLELARHGFPEDIITAIELSGLRGRGGAAFPTGKKWRAVRAQHSDEKFVIANADEGDPGAFIDRMILEDDPHCLIESMLIAGYAIGARTGYIYIRNEYPEAAVIVAQAIQEAREVGVLGDFELEIVVGKGSYVCGEETALMNSIEQRRPEVRIRPPYPTQSGLYGKPTLINNVETLANIPWIIANGGEAYRSLGFSKSRGTKVISLNSLFCRPGLFEVDFGVKVRTIVEEFGGGLCNGKLKGVLIGGPLAGIIPPYLLDTPFGFEELQSIGASVGHGGVIAFDEDTSILELLHHVFAFGSYESCGKCVPCRAGSQRIHEILDDILQNGVALQRTNAELARIVMVMRSASLCGFGTGLADFAVSVMRFYGKELEECFL